MSGRWNFLLLHDNCSLSAHSIYHCNTCIIISPLHEKICTHQCKNFFPDVFKIMQDQKQPQHKEVIMFAIKVFIADILIWSL